MHTQPTADRPGAVRDHRTTIADLTAAGWTPTAAPAAVPTDGAPAAPAPAGGGGGDGGAGPAVTATTGGDPLGLDSTGGAPPPAGGAPAGAGTPPVVPPVPGSPPAPTPPAPAPAAGADGWFASLPEPAQRAITELRHENAQRRIAERDAAAAQAAAVAAQQQSQQQVAQLTEAIGKLFGFTPDVAATAPPEQQIADLTRQATEASAAHTDALRELAIWRGAGDADPGRLTDSRRFMRELAGLDPTAADFDAQVAEKITAALAADPTLRRAAAVAAPPVDPAAPPAPPAPPAGTPAGPPAGQAPPAPPPAPAVPSGGDFSGRDNTADTESVDALRRLLKPRPADAP